MFNAANRYQPKKVVASVWKRTKSRPYVRLTLLCLQSQNNYLHTPFNLATTTKYIYRKSGVFLWFSKSGCFAAQKRRFYLAKQPLSRRQNEIIIFRCNYLYKTKIIFHLHLSARTRNYSTNKRLQIQNNSRQKLETSSTFPITSEPQTSYSD